MFGSVGPTPYDLAFPIGSIPVRVNPSFWIVAVIFNLSLIEHGRPDLLLIWIACLFVSILVHELGHAVVANSFGWPPQVFLYHFGGLAVYSPGYGHTTGRSILISFAGPAAGFLLYGILMATLFVLRQRGVAIRDDRLLFAILQLQWINLWWGLVNLFPVLPLDGGRISEALCERYAYRSGRELALKISVGVAAAVAVGFLLLREQIGTSMFPVILFGLLGFQNVQELQRGGRDW